LIFNFNVEIRSPNKAHLMIAGFFIRVKSYSIVVVFDMHFIELF